MHFASQEMLGKAEICCQEVGFETLDEALMAAIDRFCSDEH